MNARARQVETAAARELTHKLVHAVAEVVPLAQAKRIVAEALALGEIESVPDRPEELLFFTSGPLYECTLMRLGRDDADAVLLAVSPVLDRSWELDRSTLQASGGEHPPYDPSAGDSAHAQLANSGVVRASAPSEPVLLTQQQQLSEPVVSSGVVERGVVQSGAVESGAVDMSAVESGGQRKASHVRRAEPPPPLGTEEVAELDQGAADTLPAEDSSPSLPGERMHHGEDSSSEDSAPEDSAPEDSAPDTQSQPEVRYVSDTWAEVGSEPPSPSMAPGAMPPSSRGRTIPYMPAVLAPGQGARRVMVIEGDPEQRSGLAAALRKAGMTVATADDVRVARRLIQRFVPHVVVADLETVAPDFEPLRPVLDDLLAASDDVAVVLLDDQQRGETAECVRRSFEKPTLPERVAEAVAELIAASR